ncbi:N-acetylmuramoyl-L-alanine amidase [Streptomyces sp. ICN441]|uniref:peptidoglycan recognition protein family protein n=1 Tax=Streptomyces sp. ICN441 TaxID=2558286 RepID=UPI001F0DE942|nr:N-acetylmuramoyl-L-alanine amidase [Streptomyces sp. ICN441]
MAWCPFATKMELQPESDSQPAIRPTQFIVHSIVAPWTARRTYEFWRDSTNLESHFGLGYEGDLAQYIGTETRADANAAANRRPDGTGAVSIETASNTKASDPWTEEQVEQLVRLGVWLHQRHDIPLRICRTADDPGYGYHRLHKAWSTSGTACPGDARVAQFREDVFPEIVRRATSKPAPPPVQEAPDMALTKEQDEKLTYLHWKVQRLYDNLGLLAWRRKGDDGREMSQVVGDIDARVQALETTGLTDAQMDHIAELVADKLAARLAD